MEFIEDCFAMELNFILPKGSNWADWHDEDGDWVSGRVGNSHTEVERSRINFSFIILLKEVWAWLFEGNFYIGEWLKNWLESECVSF